MGTPQDNWHVTEHISESNFDMKYVKSSQKKQASDNKQECKVKK